MCLLRKQSAKFLLESFDIRNFFGITITLNNVKSSISINKTENNQREVQNDKQIDKTVTCIFLQGLKEFQISSQAALLKQFTWRGF